MADDPRHGRIESIVQRFAAGDGERSVALSVLRGPPLEVSVNGDAVRPAASLVKIPIVAAAHAMARSGALDLEATVARSELGHTEYSTVLSAFSAAHLFTLRELCALALVASDNLAADHVLSVVGTAAANDTAAWLAGPSTRVEVGFSDPFLGPAGFVNATTAHEALRMIKAIVLEPVHDEIAFALRNNIRNPRLPLRLAQLRCASKGGTLQGVVNDVGVLFGAEHDVAVAFLCEGQRDREATALELGDCMLAIWQALGDPRGGELRA